MRAIAFAACGFLLCVPQVLHAEALPAALAADPMPDKANPAATRSVSIPSHGVAINGLLYLASGAGPHPTVLLLHGFPGAEQNLDVAQAMRRAGWNVLTMHYRGAWGSAGAFSFSNSLEDTQAAVAFLRNPENATRYRVDPSRIVLAGHSMGGFFAEKTAALDPAIAGVVLFSAWDIGASAASLTQEQKPGLAAGWNSQLGALSGCTGESLVADMVSHAKGWGFNDDGVALKSRPILILTANDGFVKDAQNLTERLRAAGATDITAEHIDTDHAYSDHRVALTASIVRWLGNLKALRS